MVVENPRTHNESRKRLSRNVGRLGLARDRFRVATLLADPGIRQRVWVAQTNPAMVRCGDFKKSISMLGEHEEVTSIGDAGANSERQGCNGWIHYRRSRRKVAYPTAWDGSECSPRSLRGRPAWQGWPASGAGGELNTQAVGRGALPLRPAERNAPTHGGIQGHQLRLGVRLIHVLDPVAGRNDRSISMPRETPGIDAVPQARPSPVLRSIDEVGAKRIPLDISADREKMLVIGDGKRLETSLVERAGT